MPGEVRPLEVGGLGLRLENRESGLAARLIPLVLENSNSSCIAWGLIRSRDECSPPNMDTDGDEFLNLLND